MLFPIKSNSRILLFSFWTLCTYCTGQNAHEGLESKPGSGQSKIAAAGKSVSEMTEGIMVVFQDSQNNYWFGGSEQGVYKYDGKILVLYTMEDGLCSHDVLGIQEDKFGNLYFDTLKGVSKFDGQRFSTLEIIDGIFSKNEWKLEPDDLWFRMGWNKNGPYRYDGKSLYYLEFPKTSQADKFYAKYPNASFTPYGIYSMYTDSKGSLWFGTSSLGACRYDGKTISWLYERHLVETPDGGNPGIRTILEDKNGHFWISNTHYRYEILPESSVMNGTIQVNYRKETGIGYAYDNGEIDYPYFMSIAENKEGDLWIVTYSDGVWRYDGHELHHYPIKDGDANVLLYAIYKDNQGMLWLVSHNAGVYNFNGKTFEKFRP